MNSIKNISTIDEYIATLPKNTGHVLAKIRALIIERAPTATETITYGIPTFKLHSKNLVHFGGYEYHIGFYPTPSGIEAFKHKLIDYEISKGTIKFPLDKPIPYELIKEIVEFRIKSLS